ncbi:RT12 protein, partial [Ploceus nigricollis]|nr:RT12 protein [Ploceus nigricollis]
VPSAAPGLLLPSPPPPPPCAAMATLNQMHRQGRPAPPPRKPGPTLGRPQIKGGEHHIVLGQGGRTQDLPGVKLTVVRGKFDCAHVQAKK